MFSLLSTAGPLSEAAFYERIATLFTGHDLPDETLVRACLDSYRSLASTPDRLVTGDDLLRRSQEHTELLAAITEAGHRLGMRVWLAEREQARRHGRGTPRRPARRPRARRLPRQHRPGGRRPRRGRCDLVHPRARSRCCSRSSGRPCSASRSCAATPASAPDERLVRFLVVAPERTDLVRHKLERSPLLRAAMEEHGWNIIKWDHLRTFLAAETPGPRRPRAAARPRPGRRARRRADAAVRRLSGRALRYALHPPRSRSDRASALHPGGSPHVTDDQLRRGRPGRPLLGGHPRARTRRPPRSMATSATPTGSRTPRRRVGPRSAR